MGESYCRFIFARAFSGATKKAEYSVATVKVEGEGVYICDLQNYFSYHV